MRIFLLQVCKFSVIILFNLYKILEHDRYNIYTYLRLSEFLILRKKSSADFCFDHWSTKAKKNQSTLKKCHTATGEPLQKSTIFNKTPLIALFFDSPCISIIRIWDLEFYFEMWQTYITFVEPPKTFFRL